MELRGLRSTRFEFGVGGDMQLVVISNTCFFEKSRWCELTIEELILSRCRINTIQFLRNQRKFRQSLEL